MTRTDMQLKEDIQAELRWDPKVNAAQIGVSVDHGAVSLLGAVDSYAQKSAAEEAARRVHGVRSIAQDLTVKLLADHERSDSDIAAAVQSALKWHVFVPATITATVANSAVTLKGQAVWNFERDAAERAVRHLAGVVAVYNSVVLKPHVAASQVKEKVEAALERQAPIDGSSIHVETLAGRVTLTGTASSWHASDNAVVAAWATPGVTEVVDHIKVSITH